MVYERHSPPWKYSKWRTSRGMNASHSSGPQEWMPQALWLGGFILMTNHCKSWRGSGYAFFWLSRLSVCLYSVPSWQRFWSKVWHFNHNFIFYTFTIRSIASVVFCACANVTSHSIRALGVYITIMSIFFTFIYVCGTIIISLNSEYCTWSWFSLLQT
jgi:hypothetical protein